MLSIVGLDVYFNGTGHFMKLYGTQTLFAQPNQRVSVCYYHSKTTYFDQWFLSPNKISIIEMLWLTEKAHLMNLTLEGFEVVEFNLL